MSVRRARPLVLVATPNADLAERLVREVRREGSIACLARSADGCLRVATSVGPDVVLLDARLPDRLRAMLRAHPATARSRIVPVSDSEATWSERVEAAPRAYRPPHPPSPPVR